MRNLRKIITWLAIGGGLPGYALAGELILAKVDGEPITLQQLKVDFEARHRGHMSMLADESVVRDFLDAAIQKRLFIQEASRIGLAQKPQVVEAVHAERSRLGALWLYRHEVENKTEVSEAEIEEALSAMKRVRHVVWIQTDSADEARQARERVAAGEDPMEVAREVSTDRSRLRGGVKRVAWGAYPERVEREILGAVDGAITPTVELETGWVFAVVLSSEAMGDEPEELRRTAERVLRKRNKDRMRDRFLDDLRIRYRARIHQELLTRQTLETLLGAEQGGQDPRPIAEFDGGKILIEEFVAGIRKDKFFELRPGQRLRWARHLLSDRLDQNLVEREAVRRWDDAPDEIKAELDFFEDDLVFRALVSEVILRDLEPGDEQLRTWYREHLDRYVEPARVNLAVALLESNDQAIGFLEAVRAGAPFSELARERSRDPASAVHGGKVGWVARDGVVTELRDELFPAGATALGGPVAIDQGWLVYSVLERTDARQKEFDEVRDAVHADLLESESQSRMKAWESRLREVAEIKIRGSAIRKAGRILEEEQAARRRERGAGSDGPHGGRP